RLAGSASSSVSMSGVCANAPDDAASRPRANRAMRFIRDLRFTFAEMTLMRSTIAYRAVGPVPDRRNSVTGRIVGTYMTRPIAPTLCLLLVVASMHPAQLSAQAPSDLAGTWTLNRQMSQFPRQLGFRP